MARSALWQSERARFLAALVVTFLVPFAVAGMQLLGAGGGTWVVFLLGLAVIFPVSVVGLAAGGAVLLSKPSKTRALLVASSVALVPVGLQFGPVGVVALPLWIVLLALLAAAASREVPSIALASGALVLALATMFIAFTNAAAFAYPDGPWQTPSLVFLGLSPIALGGAAAIAALGRRPHTRKSAIPVAISLAAFVVATPFWANAASPPILYEAVHVSITKDDSIAAAINGTYTITRGDATLLEQPFRLDGTAGEGFQHSIPRSHASAEIVVALDDGRAQRAVLDLQRGSSAVALVRIDATEIEIIVQILHGD